MCSPKTLEVCRILRLVLWAMRCGMLAERSGALTEEDLSDGFELAGLTAARGELRVFARLLSQVDWSLTAWHDPRCCCVSQEELVTLRALGDTAQRQRAGDGSASHWWGLLLPTLRATDVDLAARCWLVALERTGVRMPAPEDLAESLAPVEHLVDGRHSPRVH